MSRKPKSATLQQLESMLKRAGDGSERLGMPDVAERYRAMTPEEYAEEKGIEIIENPASKHIISRRREKTMTTTTTDPRTKQQILEENEALLELLDEVWNVHVDLDDSSSKDDLIEASDETCDLLNEYDPERFPMDEDDDEAEGDEGGE